MSATRSRKFRVLCRVALLSVAVAALAMLVRTPPPTVAQVIKKGPLILSDKELGPQKIKVLKYLSTLGCNKCCPGIEEAFFVSLVDVTEEVRLTAVESLGKMAGRPCPECGDVFCSERIAKRLDDMAHARDPKDPAAWFEPSERVREEARKVLAILDRVEPTATVSDESDPEAPAADEGAESGEKDLMDALRKAKEELTTDGDRSTPPSDKRDESSAAASAVRKLTLRRREKDYGHFFDAIAVAARRDAKLAADRNEADDTPVDRGVAGICVFGTQTARPAVKALNARGNDDVDIEAVAALWSKMRGTLPDDAEAEQLKNALKGVRDSDPASNDDRGTARADIPADRYSDRSDDVYRVAERLRPQWNEDPELLKFAQAAIAHQKVYDAELRDRAKALREAARKLDAIAADLNDAEFYDEADELFDAARSLRLTARKWGPLAPNTPGHLAD